MIEMEDPSGRIMALDGRIVLSDKFPGIVWSASDGYDWLYRMEENGWHVPSIWGKDGWDAGDWPYQIVAISPTESGHFVVATYTEGDILVHGFETRAEAHAHVDKWVAYIWNNRENGPDDLEIDANGLPKNPDHRGPYREG